MRLREIFLRRAVIYQKNRVNSIIRTIHTKDIQTSQKRVEWHEAAWVWIKKRGCSRAASQLEPSCLRHCWLSLFLWSYRPIDVPSHGQCDPHPKNTSNPKVESCHKIKVINQHNYICTFFHFESLMWGWKHQRNTSRKYTGKTKPSHCIISCLSLNHWLYTKSLCDNTHWFVNTCSEAQRLVLRLAPSWASSSYCFDSILNMDVWVIPEVSNDWSMTAERVPPAGKPTTLDY